MSQPTTSNPAHAPGPFDVFISYSRKDNHPQDPSQGWVTALHQFILSSARLPGGTAPRVFFDALDIRDFDDWRHRILSALRHSKVLLVCLSPNYFASANCRWEWEHFLKRQGPHAQGEGDTIQGVRFIELPGSVAAQNGEWLASVRRSNTIDLQPWFAQGAAALQQESEAQARAQRAVDALLARITHARRELAREYGNLRAANEHFVGRQKQLRDLHERVGVGRLGVITALHGLGGIGKTELAVQYANDYARSFPGGIWWINAAGKDDLKLCLASLIDDPRFPQPPAPITDDERRYAHVMHTLRQTAEQRRSQDPDGGSQVLILLDNVDDLALLGANQRAHIGNLPWLSLLATTRDSAAAWARADRLSVLALDALDPEDALALIREWQPGHAFATADDAAAAAELCTLLGCFTLAVEQAAIYLGTQAGASLPGFVERLRAQGLQQLDALAAKAELQATMQHQDKQLGMVLAQTLPPAGTLEGVLLDYAACWGPDAVPRPWIEDLARAQHAELLQTDAFGAEPLPTAWDWLLRRRLLTAGARPELLRMHRLVRTHVLAGADQARVQVLAQIKGEQARMEYQVFRQAIAAWRIETLEAWATTDPADRTRLRAITLGVLATHASFARSLSAAASLAQASWEVCAFCHAADPSNAQAQRDLAVSLEKIGVVKAAQGDAPDALNAYQRSLNITEALAKADPSNAQAQRDLSISLEKIGDIKATQGDALGALKAYQRSLAIAETLAKANPSNAQAQRDLAVSLERIGNTKASQGDAQGALKAYQQGLNIAETLAKADPSNAQAQGDLATSLERIGNIKVAEGDALSALIVYQQSLNIRDTLAKADPNNAQAQRDLSVSLEKIGSVKATQGDVEGALDAYQQSLAIRDALAKADPSNSQARRDLSISLNNIGDIKFSQGDMQGALNAYQQGLAMAETLAKADPSNAEAQRDLSVSLEKIGDIKVTQGDALGALGAYQQTLNIAAVLAETDPSNARAQRDLSVSLIKIGNIKATQGDAPGALNAYQQSLNIRDALANADPSNAQAQRDLWIGLTRIGYMKAIQGDAPGALTAYQQGLNIGVSLAKADPSNAQAQRDLWVTHWGLGKLATERAVEIHHAREIDRIFTALQARGTHIAPGDRQFWDQIKQWLHANAA